LVQRIVRAYEKYNELVGAGRQLTLRLAENTPEFPPDAVAASPDAARSAGPAASLESVISPVISPASLPGAPNA
jgi:hypothetical protein